MLVDKERRFLLQLSVALSVPVFELEQWPYDIIQEYRALNVVSPFIQDAENTRDGILIQLIRNQNVTKKQHIRTAEQILPYLQEFPEYLEHPTVKKVQGLISCCRTDEALADLMNKVAEEIEIEGTKESPDKYVLARLSDIYLKYLKGAK